MILNQLLCEMFDLRIFLKKKILKNLQYMYNYHKVDTKNFTKKCCFQMF